MVRQNSSAAVVLQLLSFLQVSRCVSAKKENAATSPLGVVTSAPERTEEWSFPSCLHYSLSGTHRVQRSTIRVDCYSCPVTPTFRAGSHHLCSALLRWVRERDTQKDGLHFTHQFPLDLARRLSPSCLAWQQQINACGRMEYMVHDTITESYMQVKGKWQLNK